jgi:hypothetical protein
MLRGFAGAFGLSAVRQVASQRTRMSSVLAHEPAVEADSPVARHLYLDVT